MSKMKVLNLYAGIGGNRKLWKDVDVTAVELDPKIAAIYQDFFPNDKVVVADAHQYLLEHFEEYDFIWGSPPCPSHSRVRKATRHQNKPIYPDMKLYEEILLLKHYFDGKWVIENVIAFYKPLIAPQEFGNHYFWTNFYIKPIKTQSRKHDSGVKELQKRKGFNIEKYKSIDKVKTLRNCVEPELGLHILEAARKNEHSDLFNKKENNV